MTKYQPKVGEIWTNNLTFDKHKVLAVGYHKIELVFHENSYGSITDKGRPYYVRLENFYDWYNFKQEDQVEQQQQPKVGEIWQNKSPTSKKHIRITETSHGEVWYDDSYMMTVENMIKYWELVKPPELGSVWACNNTGTEVTVIAITYGDNVRLQRIGLNGCEHNTYVDLLNFYKWNTLVVQEEQQSQPKVGEIYLHTRSHRKFKVLSNDIDSYTEWCVRLQEVGRQQAIHSARVKYINKYYTLVEQEEQPRQPKVGEIWTKNLDGAERGDREVLKIDTYCVTVKKLNKPYDSKYSVAHHNFVKWYKFNQEIHQKQPKVGEIYEHHSTGKIVEVLIIDENYITVAGKGECSYPVPQEHFCEWYKLRQEKQQKRPKIGSLWTCNQTNTEHVIHSVTKAGDVMLQRPAEGGGTFSFYVALQNFYKWYTVKPAEQKKQPKVGETWKWKDHFSNKRVVTVLKVGDDKVKVENVENQQIHYVRVSCFISWYDYVPQEKQPKVGEIWRHKKDKIPRKVVSVIPNIILEGMRTWHSDAKYFLPNYELVSEEQEIQVGDLWRHKYWDEYTTAEITEISYTSICGNWDWRAKLVNAVSGDYIGLIRVDLLKLSYNKIDPKDFAPF